jgi:hypothetical protein
LDRDKIPNINSTFKEFVDEMPEWESDLLKNVCEFKEATPLYKCMMREETLMLVSDGGAKDEF